MIDGPSDALLLETFGTRLLAYLCAVEEERLDERFRDGNALPDLAESALTQLIPLAESVAKKRLDQPGFPLYLSLDVLGAVPDGADTSIGNLVRRSAGGTIDVPPDTNDRVTALLYCLARDAYPRLLVPIEERWQFMHLSFYRHPLRAELQEAVHEDEAISRLYPSEDGELGRRGAVFNNLGRGGTVQSVMFGETLIGAAWDQATMLRSSPSLMELYSSVGELVSVLRSAISGRPAQVRALVAFTGFSTSGRSVATPWGALRPIAESERASAPSMLDGAVSGTDVAGSNVTVSYAGEVVLDTTLPFVLDAHAWEDGDDLGFPSGREQPTALRALRRRSEAVQLAVLLAAPRPAGQWATARYSWQWLGDPMTPGGARGWADPRALPGFMPTVLAEQECADLETWCDLIESAWSPSIDIAVRRTLSAAQVRTDPSDRLVDSVVAWENLFGTSEGEPRLRVSSAMAWLLADSATDRASLQKEVRQLYDDRSKIVHGATFDEAAIAERGNRALELAIACLGALIRDRVDVLSLPDGSARSLRLILGG